MNFSGLEKKSPTHLLPATNKKFNLNNQQKTINNEKENLRSNGEPVFSNRTCIYPKNHRPETLAGT
jgi:hypothetical protein